LVITRMSWLSATKPSPPPAARDALPPPEQAIIFACLFAGLFGLISVQRKRGKGYWLPTCAEKREYEVWVLLYSVVWMGSFAVIIAAQLFELFGALEYLLVCGGLALPLLLQPFLWRGSEGKKVALFEQHAMRAQIWIALFSFVGNYWYTHYFYAVLEARYSMPSWRVNDVPIAMYFATHFYFSTYHVLAGLALRKVTSSFEAGTTRTALYWYAVLTMAYCTAFMETLTICHYPYYSFADRRMAYTVGSAFYGIYFLVSYPAYAVIDEPPESAQPRTPQQKVAWTTPPTPRSPMQQVVWSSLGTGMLVLILLDFGRLATRTPLQIGGVAFEATDV